MMNNNYQESPTYTDQSADQNIQAQTVPEPLMQPPSAYGTFAPPQTDAFVYNVTEALPEVLSPFQKADWLLALAYAATGFLLTDAQAWGWGHTGLGTTVFYLIPLIVTFVYLRSRGIKQDRASMALFVLAVLGALPYALYGTQPILGWMLMFECSVCLLWLAYSCKTLTAIPLGWMIAFDAINQYLIVPFANMSYVVRRMIKRDDNSKTSVLTVLIVVGVLLVTFPLLATVISLLANSDIGFENLVNTIKGYVSFNTIEGWVRSTIFGLPLALFLLALTLGNVHRRKTAKMKRDSLLQTFTKVHVLPHIAIIVSLSLFIVVYCAYAIVMSSYLLSAFSGQLPDGFTYAEYARRGFFELLTVVVINVILLAGVWFFAKRESDQYPRSLRIMTAIISALTCMLIATAASKMYLYVQAYGLTLLRFSTSCFMLILAVSFVCLLVWTVKQFNLARPIIALSLVVFTVIMFICPTRLIANYNTDRYLSGSTTQMDVYEISTYGSSALPALRRLQAEAPDAEVRSAAARYRIRIQENKFSSDKWYEWNLFDQLNGFFKAD
jgi:hypothetical protein